MILLRARRGPSSFVVRMTFRGDKEGSSEKQMRSQQPDKTSVNEGESRQTRSENTLFPNLSS